MHDPEVHSKPEKPSPATATAGRSNGEPPAHGQGGNKGEIPNPRSTNNPQVGATFSSTFTKNVQMVKSTFFIDKDVTFNRFESYAPTAARRDAQTRSHQRHIAEAMGSAAGSATPHQREPPDRPYLVRDGGTTNETFDEDLYPSEGQILNMVDSFHRCDISKNHLVKSPVSPPQSQWQWRDGERPRSRSGSRQADQEKGQNPNKGRRSQSANRAAGAAVSHDPYPFTHSMSSEDHMINRLVNSLQNNRGLSEKLCKFLEENDPGFDPLPQVSDFSQYDDRAAFHHNRNADINTSRDDPVIDTARGSKQKSALSQQEPRLNLPPLAEKLWRQTRAAGLLIFKAKERVDWLRDLNNAHIQNKWATGEEPLPLYVRSSDKLLERLAGIRQEMGYFIQEEVAKFLEEEAVEQELDTQVVMDTIKQILSKPGDHSSFEEAETRLANLIGREAAELKKQLSKRKVVLESMQHDKSDFIHMFTTFKVSDQSGAKEVQTDSGETDGDGKGTPAPDPPKTSDQPQSNPMDQGRVPKGTKGPKNKGNKSDQTEGTPNPQGGRPNNKPKGGQSKPNTGGGANLKGFRIPRIQTPNGQEGDGDWTKVSKKRQNQGNQGPPSKKRNRGKNGRNWGNNNPNANGNGSNRGQGQQARSKGWFLSPREKMLLNEYRKN